jgi:hypothetical protein
MKPQAQLFYLYKTYELENNLEEMFGCKEKYEEVEDHSVKYRLLDDIDLANQWNSLYQQYKDPKENSINVLTFIKKVHLYWASREIKKRIEKWKAEQEEKESKDHA